MLLVKLNLHRFLNLGPRTDGTTVAPPPSLFNKNKTQQKYQRRFFFSLEKMFRLLSRQPKRVTNYKLLCRSISTVKQVKPAYIKSPLTSTTAPFQQLQGKRWTFMNQKRNATTNHDLSYKQTPFLQWKLFPDFEHLVTQTAPAIAVPAFQKLIEAAKAQFIELEKTFEPTWEGTIGKCKCISEKQTII